MKIFRIGARCARALGVCALICVLLFVWSPKAAADTAALAEQIKNLTDSYTSNPATTESDNTLLKNALIGLLKQIVKVDCGLTSPDKIDCKDKHAEEFGGAASPGVLH